MSAKTLKEMVRDHYVRSLQRSNRGDNQSDSIVNDQDDSYLGISYSRQNVLANLQSHAAVIRVVEDKQSLLAQIDASSVEGREVAATLRSCFEFLRLFCSESMKRNQELL